MKDDRCLIDSNILVYAYDKSDTLKHEKCLKILRECFKGNSLLAVSIQNLSEFFVIITRKVQKPLLPSQAKIIVQDIVNSNYFVKIEPQKEQVLEAINLSMEKGISYWDSLIAAAMKKHDIFCIYTENEKEFKKIEWLNVVNPLK